MIITKSPLRVSFVGGSDFPSFYNHDIGAFLSVSINKYIYISSHKFFSPDQVRLRGLSAGTAGAKLFGAGESGFLLFYCDEKHQQKLRAELAELRELSFNFENKGARLIYYGDEEKN